MASDLDLQGDDDLRFSADDFLAESEIGAIAGPEAGIGDFGRAAAIGGYNVVGSGASAGQYVSGADDSGVLGATRKWADEGAGEQLKGMSRQGQRELNAKWLPTEGKDDIWDEGISIRRALGLQATAAGASLAATVGTGVLLGSSLGATAAGAGVAGVAGALSIGDVFSTYQKAVEGSSTEELKRDNPLFAALLEEGMTEPEARRALMDEIAGAKPYIAGLISAGTSVFGVEHFAGKLAAGQIVSGIRRGVVTGAAGETAQEAIESGSQEYLGQLGTNELTGKDTVDWYDVLNAAVSGAVVGGATGGAVGGVAAGLSGRGNKARVTQTPIVDPDQEAAIAGSSDAGADRPSPAEAAPSLPQQPASIDEELEQAGRDLDNIEAGTVAAALPSPRISTANEFGVSETEAAAIDTSWMQELDSDPDMELPATAPSAGPPDLASQPAPAPVTSEVTSPIPEQTPPAAIAPEVAAPISAPAAEPALATPEAAQQAMPDIAQEPPGPRVLPSQIAEQRDATTRAAELARRDELDAGTATTEARSRTSSRQSSAEAARVASGESLALTLPTEADFNTNKGRRAFRAKASGIVRAAEKSSVEAPMWARKAVASQAKTARGVSAKLRSEGMSELRAAYDEAVGSTRSAVESNPDQAVRKTSVAAKADARRSQIEQGEAEAQQLLRDTPMSGRAAKGDPAALRQYIDTLLAEAKKRNITIPADARTTRSREDDVEGDAEPDRVPPALLHLMNARGVRRVALSPDARDQRQSFVSNDFFVRRGEADALYETRKVEGDTASKRAGYDEARVDGRDDVADHDEASERAASTDDAPSTVKLGGAPSEEVLADDAPTPEARDRAPVKVGSDAVTTGVNRAGAFKVEARRRNNRPTTNPTDAQKAAGNYKMGHRAVQGLPITIETMKGVTRRGVSPDGAEWSVKMPAHYGYVKRTKGADGDHVDVYIGPNPDADTVYVVNQHDAGTGQFDEHKALIGFRSESEALETYRKGFSDGRGAERARSVVPMTMAEFKQWLDNPGRRPAVLPDASEDIDELAPLYSLDREGRTERFDKDLAAWRVHMGRVFDGTATQSERIALRHNYVLEHSGLGGGTITANLLRLQKIMKDHPDVPRIVWDNLPTLLADPVAAFRRQTGEVNVVLSATTARREPIVVGIRNGDITTVTPFNNGDVPGVERLAGHVLRPLDRGETVYIKDRSVLAWLQQLQGRQFPHRPQGDLHQRGRSGKYHTRTNVLAGAGRIFYRQDVSSIEGTELTRVQNLQGGYSPRPSQKDAPRPARSSNNSGARAEFNSAQWLDENAVSKQLLSDALTAAPSFSGLRGTVHTMLGRRLARLAGNVPVYTVSPQNMMLATSDKIASGELNGPPRGYYDPRTGAIVVREDIMRSPADAADLVMHEGLHAAVSGAINTNAELRGSIDTMIADMRHVIEAEALLGGRDSTLPYGLTNAHEFISEAFSNREFQQLLSQTEASPAIVKSLGLDQKRKFSVWEAFVNAVRKFLFGRVGDVPYTMLEATIRATEQLMVAAEARPSRSSAIAFSQDRRVTQAGNSARDTSAGLAGWLNRAGYNLATLDQIRQVGAGHFIDAQGDALDSAVAAIQKMRPHAGNLKREGDAITQEFLEFAKRSPQVAADFADLAVDATMLNVAVVNDPDWNVKGEDGSTPLESANTHLGKNKAGARQAKQQLAGLQKRFMALPADARTMWGKQQSYFRGTQNAVARAAAENILETVGDKLTPEQRASLLDKTMAGTLTEEDGALFQSPTIFNDLRAARQLRALNGVYFPLMRHGRHVVRTELAMGDLLGGQEIEPGLVEFRAATDKEARAKFNAFADKTTLVINDVRKSYYLRETGERLRPIDAVGQDVDVAYRAYVQKEGVNFFDTAAEAERFRREAASDANFAKVSTVMDRANGFTANDLSSTQLASLLNSVNHRTDLQDGQKEQLRVAIYQASARMMSGTRIQQRAIARRNVAGASKDVARVILQYAEASSGYLAKMKFMPQVREAMSRMRRIAKANTYAANRDTLSRILNELDSRVAKNVDAYQEPNKFVSDLMTISFLDKLMSPAYSALNATQVGMVTLPWLAGQYGVGRSVRAITRAYVDVGIGRAVWQGTANTARAVQGVRDITLDTSDVVGSIRANIAKASDAAEAGALLDFLQERGALDDEAGFEIANAVSQGRGAWGTSLSRVDRVARQMPFAIEAVNRAVSGLAAYRLARGRGLTDAQAREMALNVVMTTQGDYSAVNAPPLFNSQIGRLPLQFKKYGQLMSFVMVDMLKRAYAGETLEVKRAAMKQIATLFAVQIAMAGAFSVPGWELVRAAAIIGGLFGAGGGSEDLERKLRQIAEESLGKRATELITSGVISRELGIDLSSRLSLADMVLFGEPKDYGKQGITAYVGTLALGAPGGLAVDWAEGIQAAGDGDWPKAFEKLFPVKVVADTAKAIRLHNAGELSIPGAATQAFGITPASQANLWQERNARTADRKQRASDKRSLERAYIASKNQGDRAKAVSRIREFNKSAPWRERISTKSLDRRASANN